MTLCPQHALPWQGKLIRVAIVLCLCFLPPGWAAEDVVDASLAAARAGFQPAVTRAWELARAGWFDGALAVVNEARRHTTDAGEMAKLDAMIITYTMLKQRADVEASQRPPAATPAPRLVAPQAAPPAPGSSLVSAPVPLPPAATVPAAAPAAAQVSAELTAHAAPSLAGSPAAPREPGPTGTYSRLNPLAWFRPTRHEPGAWEFSIGPALRWGGEVDFSKQTLRRPDGGRYVNGRHTGANDFLIEGDPADTAAERVSPQLDLIGWQTVDPPGPGDNTYFRNVTFDQSTLDGENTDLDSTWGIAAGATRNLGPNLLRASRLTFDLGLSHSEAELSATQGHGITTQTLTGILYKEGGAVPGYNQPLTPYQEQDGTATPASEATLNLNMTEELFAMGGARTTTTTVDMEAETHVATLSLGLQYDVAATDWLTLVAGAGPAIHVAMLRTSVEQHAVWDAPAHPLHGQRVPNFAAEEDGSDVAICGGFFLSLGTQAQLTQRLAFALSLRLDEVFGSAETDQAEFDLSGFVGDVRLVFTF